MNNGQTQLLSDIPTLSYEEFSVQILDLLAHSFCHCVNYFAYPLASDKLKAIACIANDKDQIINVLSYECPRPSAQTSIVLPSLTAKVYALHIFERELHENWGIHFEGHPWLKPLRYPAYRYDKQAVIQDYPFYKIEGGELHEVGVGPIHAGVIEPGHFRFLCHGETVYHLEIQLGWQHRGVEPLYLSKKKPIQRHLLSESIAGDTAIGHNYCFTRAAESLAGIEVPTRLKIERCIALELERIAMHLFDLSNLCIGVAYQLGSSVIGSLRTPIINFMQAWSGNRFGKSLIRIGGSPAPLTEALRLRLLDILQATETRFHEMAQHLFHLPSVQSRFDGIGKVSEKQMQLIGAVGITARMVGIRKDIRNSHPHDAYLAEAYEPILQENGDVLSRFWIRRKEFKRSLALIRGWLAQASYWNEELSDYQLTTKLNFAPNSLCISLIEGWRGEICHVAISDAAGELAHYKVKDPSMHNWMALALSLRNLEISDFPINNKSYDLSYCGHDL